MSMENEDNSHLSLAKQNKYFNRFVALSIMRRGLLVRKKDSDYLFGFTGTHITNKTVIGREFMSIELGYLTVFDENFQKIDMEGADAVKLWNESDLPIDQVIADNAFYLPEEI